VRTFAQKIRAWAGRRESRKRRGVAANHLCGWKQPNDARTLRRCTLFSLRCFTTSPPLHRSTTAKHKPRRPREELVTQFIEQQCWKCSSSCHILGFTHASLLSRLSVCALGSLLSPRHETRCPCSREPANGKHS